MATQSRRGGPKGTPLKESHAQGQEQRQKPVWEARRGRVRVAAWEHTSDDGPWFSFALTRIYRKPDGSWANASSLGRDDLLVAGHLLTVAYDWACHELQARSVQERGGQGDAFEGGDAGQESIPP